MNVRLVAAGVVGAAFLTGALGGAQAGEARRGRAAACKAVGEGAGPTEDVEGCFKLRSRVYVEAKAPQHANSEAHYGASVRAYYSQAPQAYVGDALPAASAMPMQSGMRVRAAPLPTASITR